MIERIGLLAATTAMALSGAAGLRRHLWPTRSATIARCSVARSTQGPGHLAHRSIASGVRRLHGWWPMRRTPVRPDDVARWCDDLARRVRAGSSLGAALLDTTNDDRALHAATAPIRHSLERGATVAESMAMLPVAEPRAARRRRYRSARAAPPGHEHLALACSVIGAVATVGGSPAAALDRAAHALRLRAIDRDDRATHAAQARLSAHVLTVMPLLVLSLSVLADADVRGVVTGRVGATCVLTGAAFNVLGWFWMRRVVGNPR